jgi:hypothetical protein
MPRRRCECHNMPSASAAKGHPATAQDTEDGGHTVADVTDLSGPGRRHSTRSVALTASSCAIGGSAGHMLGAPALAVAGFVAVVMTGGLLAITLFAMLGRRDLRSPFERLMLLLCLITDRRPKDYLPPVTAQKHDAASKPTIPAVTIVRVADESPVGELTELAP